MTNKPYNGWYNYETWNFNLWFDDSFSEDAQRFYDESDCDEEEATSNLSDYISQLADEQVDEHCLSSWMSDAISSYLGEVNFREIAEHYMNDVEKKIEEEEES